ncbi:MAG: SpoIID/LytB domain-containing protein [Elusimicrobia bacterium]|nr:SpoIID/LytB domain-containing protein [Elusimicrobiota bacterium]
MLRPLSLAVLVGWLVHAGPAPRAQAQGPQTQRTLAEASQGSRTRAGKESARALLRQGHRLYFRGDHERALKSYEAAVRLSQDPIEPLLNGAVVLAELGRPREAVRWHRRAAALPRADADALDALAWAEFNIEDLADARRHFEDALARSPEHPQALLGLARVELEASKPVEALKLLDRAGACAPLDTLIPFFKGKAYALMRDPAQEAAAWRQCVSADSFFIEAREALGLVHSRLRNFAEAWKQFSKAADADPKNKRFQTRLDEMRFAAPATPSALGDGRMPVLRVGIGANMAGKPAACAQGAGAAVSWSVNQPFWVVDASTQKKLARGQPGQTWQARRVAQKKRSIVELRGPGRDQRLKAARPVVIRPDSASEGLISVNFAPCSEGSGAEDLSDGVPRCSLRADRRLRGDLEIASYPEKRSLKLINRINLEDYTHGVLSMEMPIGSPLEALKAQAALARAHALYIKTVARRHRREGYDLCDSQHCQVYGGFGAETARSREIVKATRGMVVTYQGKPAHVIYSSNCGGHTQSGSDLTGWGSLPYWLGILDAVQPGGRASPAPSGKVWAQADAAGGGRGAAGEDGSGFPDSPWSLRLWLRSAPQAFCKPSTHVGASHSRWARVFSYRELDEKVNRRRRIGRLMALRPGHRSPGGHLNSFRVVGTRGSFTITDEMSIRSLLGIGSLRSTLFVLDTQYKAKPAGLPPGRGGRRPKGPPALVPVSVVLHGGGWGHGVGMCQSGAMGRAEAGQTFDEIIKAYFKGVEISRLSY